MNDDKEFVYMEFMFIDEFGQESRMKKSITSSTFGQDMFPAEELLLEFKNFLIASGFSNSEVDRIKYIDDRD